MSPTDIKKACCRIDLTKLCLRATYKSAMALKEKLKEQQDLSSAVDAIKICEDLLIMEKQLINIELDMINDKL